MKNAGTSTTKIRPPTTAPAAPPRMTRRAAETPATTSTPIDPKSAAASPNRHAKYDCAFSAWAFQGRVISARPLATSSM